MLRAFESLALQITWRCRRSGLAVQQCTGEGGRRRKVIAADDASTSLCTCSWEAYGRSEAEIRRERFDLFVVDEANSNGRYHTLLRRVRIGRGRARSKLGRFASPPRHTHCVARNRWVVCSLLSTIFLLRDSSSPVACPLRVECVGTTLMCFREQVKDARPCVCACGARVTRARPSTSGIVGWGVGNTAFPI